MRRFQINYTKEGFTQLFPVLFLKNNQEDAWLFGIWKWNIALVKGKNPEPERPIQEIPDTPSEISQVKENVYGELWSSAFSSSPKSRASKSPVKLTNKQIMLLAVGACAVVAFGYILIKGARAKKRK